MRERRSRSALSFAIVVILITLGRGLAAADTVSIELIGGTIATQGNGDVVLTLDLASGRINLIGKFTRAVPLTWGQLRPREASMREALLHGLFLNVNGHERPPSDVSIPGLASEPDAAPLPKFVPVEITWRDVGFLHAALAPNLVTANFHVAEMDYVQLVLDENMPWWQVLVRSIVLGFEHIVPAGLDHILFVLGIYLAASRFRDLLWQVTAFTVAHSITLGLTASGVIVVGAAWERFVEIGIAISICTVAFENCLMRRPPGWRRILVVGGFGLIHGMGFAGRLSEVKWPPGTFFLSLFGANLGIELGQLAVIGAASLVTAWWWKCAWYQGRVAVTISLLIGLYGFFAALDRISQLSFPTQAATDLFWNFYDRYYWSIPLVIGALTLAICWMTYRLSAVIYTQALSRKGR